MIVLRDVLKFLTEHLKTRDETVIAGVARRVKALLGENHPVLQFIRMCINAGIEKTQCYDDAVIAETSVRKQVQLALYDYLKSEEAPPAEMIYCYRDNLGTHGSNYVGVTLYFIEKMEMDFFEEVREHIADELETHTSLEYERSPLSTCDAEDIRIVSDVEDTDFVFEVGDLKSGKFKYWGYWHEKKWNRLKIFKEFDIVTLMRILARR